MKCCDKCQTQISKESSYCPGCGQKVEKNEIKELCLSYFAMGMAVKIIMESKKINKKIKNDYLKFLKERTPEIHAICLDPMAFCMAEAK